MDPEWAAQAYLLDAMAAAEAAADELADGRDPEVARLVAAGRESLRAARDRLAGAGRARARRPASAGEAH